MPPYRRLKLLEENPSLSQRELAGELGIRRGEASYCARALSDHGWVKMMDPGRSGHRAAYLYGSTPRGPSEKTSAARRFLDCRLEEHERIEREIETLHGELLAGCGRNDSRGTSSTQDALMIVLSVAAENSGHAPVIRGACTAPAARTLSTIGRCDQVVLRGERWLMEQDPCEEMESVTRRFRALRAEVDRAQ